MAQLKTIKIDIVSDNVCPFCFIGKRKLEQAIQQFEGLVKFDIQWHPFQLNPDASMEGVNKMQMYEQKFGKERIKQMIPYMIENGKRVGINFSYGGLIGNTIQSHRLVDYAHKQGKQNIFIEKLFNAYFEEEKNICDVDVLIEIAESAGLDKQKTENFIKIQDNSQQILKEAEYWRQKYQINGVPHFLFQNQLQVSGAQDSSVFIQAIQQFI